MKKGIDQQQAVHTKKARELMIVLEDLRKRVIDIAEDFQRLGGFVIVTSDASELGRRIGRNLHNVQKV